MVYIIIFLILALCSYYEFKGNKYIKASFNYLFVFLAFISCIRYGQGTDYFGYMRNYYITPPIHKFSSIFDLDIHGELGFVFINSIFRTFNIKFEVFAGITAVITMALIYRFIKKYSKLPITSLTLFYVLYYLVYVFSGIRQGLAIAIFIGIAIDLYREEKYKTFVLVILLAATIHSSVLIALLTLPIDKYKVSYKTYGIIIVIAAFIMIFNLDIFLIELLPQNLYEKILIYWNNSSIPLMAFANRLVTFSIILFFSSLIKEENEEIKLFKSLYIASFVLYIITIKSVTISSRISLYFKVFEIILIPNIAVQLMSYKNKLKAMQLWGISLMIATLLCIKTVNAFIGEGDYLEHVKVTNYPYISIFDKEKLWEYKGESEFFEETKEILQREGLKTK
ncbi:EpsG family protein [Clostridium sp. UBA4548]|uniref:EpsG family protein n=1 Tax=Clostridium sp. UBA4548 TaxID=1946361 RepID=UPI0025C57E11|nr:EpsG family protein [Clostridium sp. UBA4548]